MSTEKTRKPFVYKGINLGGDKPTKPWDLPSIDMRSIHPKAPCMKWVVSPPDTPKPIPYQARMEKMNTPGTEPCKQCGNCCREGGPALHVEDLEIIRSGHGPDLVHIVTLRKGEHVYDQLTHRFEPLKSEILKLRGSQGTWACTFYSNEAAMCTIYDQRPAECRALDCQAPKKLMEVYSHERIARTDLIPDGHPLLELMDEHDRQCPAEEIGRLATPAATGDEEAAAKLEHMIRYDDEIRKLVPERTGLDAESMDFFFGRPARTLLRQFATAVNLEKGGKMVFRKIPKGS